MAGSVTWAHLKCYQCRPWWMNISMNNTNQAWASLSPGDLPWSNHKAVSEDVYTLQAKRVVTDTWTWLQDVGVAPLLVCTPSGDTAGVIYHLLFLMRKLRLRYVTWPSLLGVWNQGPDVMSSWLCVFGHGRSRTHPIQQTQKAARISWRRTSWSGGQRNKLSYPKSHCCSFLTKEASRSWPSEAVQLGQRGLLASHSG